jgi:hypothetical protein
VKLRKESEKLLDIIPPLIERFRLGVIGYFSTRQSFVSGHYVGAGVYSATMEGYRVEIFAEGSTVTKILVADKTELKFISNTLLEFIKDIGWDVLHRKHATAIDYWDFNAKRMTKLKHQRSVFVEFKKLTSLTRISGSTLELEVSGYNNIRLINNDGDRRYTILSYRIKTKDLGFNDSHEPSEIDSKLPSLVSSWLRSVSPEIMELEEKILEDNDFSNWASEAIKNRLIGLNRIPNLTLTEKSEEATQEEEPVVGSDIDDIAGFAMSTLTNADEMISLFGLNDDSSSDSSESTMERLVLYGDEASARDFSWLDFLKSPFKPGMSIDSSITNKYFDMFITDYIDAIGTSFLRSFIYKLPDMRELIRIKRVRKAENAKLSDSLLVDIV